MARVSAPAHSCPECGSDLSYSSSLGGFGAYRPGDVFETSPINHYYACVPCEAKYLLTSRGNLVPLGPSPSMFRQP